MINVHDDQLSSAKFYIQETLIKSEFPTTQMMCRPRYNNLAMTQVINFEAS